MYPVLWNWLEEHHTCQPQFLTSNKPLEMVLAAGNNDVPKLTPLNKFQTTQGKKVWNLVYQREHHFSAPANSFPFLKTLWSEITTTHGFCHKHLLSISHVHGLARWNGYFFPFISFPSPVFPFPSFSLLSPTPLHSLPSLLFCPWF